MLEADAILLTEIRSSYETYHRSEYIQTDEPNFTMLVPKHIRAAHIYGIALYHVRHNFEIAGLLPQRHLEVKTKCFKSIITLRLINSS